METLGDEHHQLREERERDRLDRLALDILIPSHMSVATSMEAILWVSQKCLQYRPRNEGINQ